MSSATKPLGMRTMSSSGYNHNSTNSNKQYASWKGQGIDRYPVGTTPSLVRPLTNNDAGNIFQTGFGLARPIKHYRKGRVITAYQTQQEIADTDQSLNDNCASININPSKHPYFAAPILIFFAILGLSCPSRCITHLIKE